MSESEPGIEYPENRGSTETGASAAIPAEPGRPSTVHLPRSVHIAEDDTDEQITEKLRRHGVRLGRGMIAPRVFWPALITILLVSAFAILAPAVAETAFTSCLLYTSRCV